MNRFLAASKRQHTAAIDSSLSPILGHHSFSHDPEIERGYVFILGTRQMSLRKKRVPVEKDKDNLQMKEMETWNLLVVPSTVSIFDIFL